MDFKQPETVLIHLDSRISHTTTPYDATYNLEDAVMSSQVSRAMIHVQKISFPNSVYPINEFYNTVYWVESDASSYSVTLTDNFYDGNDIAVEIATLMSAASAINTYTGSYDSMKKKLTFTGNINTFHFTTGTKSINDQLGMYGANLTSFNLSQESLHPVYLAGTKYVDLGTNLHTKNVTIGTTYNSLLRVPLEVSFGQIVVYEPKNSGYHLISASDLTNMRFTLYDDMGNLWKLPPNTSVSITLQVHPILRQTEFNPPPSLVPPPPHGNPTMMPPAKRSRPHPHPNDTHLRPHIPY